MGLWLTSVGNGQEEGPVEIPAELQAIVERLDSDSGKERVAASRELDKGLRENFNVWREPALRLFRELGPEDIEQRMRMREALRAVAVWFHHERPERGFVGVTLARVTVIDEKKKRVPAMKIVSVVENTAASENEVKSGDLVIGIDGIGIPERTNVQEFITYIQTKSAGEEVRLDFIRDGKLDRLEFDLGKRPQDLASAAYPRRTERADDLWFEQWLAASFRQLKELDAADTAVE